MSTWEEFFRSAPGISCVLYCCVYAALGLCLSTFGPVILDLSVQTSANLRDTGFCLIIRSLGYLLGSFLGFLYDKFPGHRLLSIAMGLAGLGTLGITWARSSIALSATVSLQGIAMGLIDTGCNLLLLWLFLDKSGPPMQAMHCAFAVGATLGPFLLRIVESMKLGVGSTTVGTELVGVGSYNGAFYIIAALCAVLSVVLFFVESPKSRSSPPMVESSGNDSAGVDTGSIVPGESVKVSETVVAGTPTPPAVGDNAFSFQKWRIVIVTATLLGIYVGVETGYGSYVTAFSVLHVGSTEADGQLLAGVYWAAIMVGRFASIWIASMISADLFLKASMGASAVSAIFLLVTGGAGSIPLWLGSIAFGLSMACVYPTTLTLVDTFFPILGRHVTLIMIGSATGEMALPAIIASFFGGTVHDVDLNGQDTVKGGSPMVLMWVLAVFCPINFALLYLLLRFGNDIKEKLSSSQQVKDNNSVA